MTEDELLTLTLPERIKWLRSDRGPHGKMSHDRLAKILGTTRQVVIGWEQGAEPSTRFRVRLSDFSGFRPEMFSRREAEDFAAASTDRRLRSLEDRADRAEETLRRVLRALDKAGIDVQAARAASRSPASAPRRRRATGTDG